MTAVFDQTSNAIHMAQYSNCGSNEKEITAQMDWSSVKGDCEAPDFEAANADSDPLAPSNGTGTGASDSQDSSAATWRRSVLSQWVMIWVVIYAIYFGTGHFV
jgi:hypothetical protein